MSSLEVKKRTDKYGDVSAIEFQQKNLYVHLEYIHYEKSRKWNSRKR